MKRIEVPLNELTPATPFQYGDHWLMIHSQIAAGTTNCVCIELGREQEFEESTQVTKYDKEKGDYSDATFADVCSGDAFRCSGQLYMRLKSSRARLLNATVTTSNLDSNVDVHCLR